MPENLYETLYQVLSQILKEETKPVLISRAYPTEATLPQLARDASAVFFDLLPERGMDPAYTELHYANQKETRRRILTLTLKLICYGPSALQIAYTILTGIYEDLGPASPRAFLRSKNLLPVKDPSEPLMLHEPEGGLWRTRADLSISLRSVLPTVTTYESVTEPPDLRTQRNTTS